MNMSWTSVSSRRNNPKVNTRISTNVLKLCMPPNAPQGMTFQQVIEREYDCLLRSSILANSLRAEWKKPASYVTSKDPMCLYRRRILEVRPQVHIGQLKLFLSELQFLTEFAYDSIGMVIYAGAADGLHIAFLAQLFPKLTFNLYDPRPFSPVLNGIKNVNLNTGDSGWFSFEIAARYRYAMSTNPTLQRDVFLISDIRSGDHQNPKCDFEECCIRDMQFQKEWMKILKPKAAMFKFRLSYLPGKTKWLTPASPMHIKYGIFAARGATEMRLICTDPAASCEYDNTEMEERAYYFNNCTRVCQYGPIFPNKKQNQIAKKLRLDHCWDCCAMKEVCMEFLSKKWSKDTFNDDGVVLEVAEDVEAAITTITSIPSGVSKIIAEYATPVNEDELYGFIDAAMRNCGSSAFFKMQSLPHGISDPGVQWIDRMDSFRGAPLILKKGKKRVDSEVAKFLRKLYSSAGIHAPPLGEYPMHNNSYEEL